MQERITTSDAVRTDRSASGSSSTRPAESTWASDKPGLSRTLNGVMLFLTFESPTMVNNRETDIVNSSASNTWPETGNWHRQEQQGLDEVSTHRTQAKQQRQQRRQQTRTMKSGQRRNRDNDENFGIEDTNIQLINDTETMKMRDILILFLYLFYNLDCWTVMINYNWKTRRTNSNDTTVKIASVHLIHQVL